MRYAILISVVVLFFCSCADNSKKELEMIKFLNEGLVNSTKAITYSNYSIYHSFEEKLRDFKYYNVEKWRVKAEQVRLASDSAVQYINQIKHKVQDTLGLNEDIVKNLIDVRSEELFDRLIQYRNSLLLINSSMTIQFINSLKFFSDDFDYRESNAAKFRDFFFSKTSTLRVLVTLNKFENNVKINENDLINYCLAQVYSGCNFFSRFSAIVGQSINYVKGGDSIEINGGVGYFSTVAKTVMKINGVEVEANNDGVATYKLKSSTKAGIHKVLVTIEYISQDSTQESKTYNIEYTVIDPHQK